MKTGYDVYTTDVYEDNMWSMKFLLYEIKMWVLLHDELYM